MAITRSQICNKQKASKKELHQIDTSRNKPRKAKNIAARQSNFGLSRIISANVDLLAYRRERLQTAIRSPSWTHKKSHWIDALNMATAAFGQSQRAQPSDNSSKPLPYGRLRRKSGRTAHRTISRDALKNPVLKTPPYYVKRRLKGWLRLIESLHLPLVPPVQGRKEEPHNRSCLDRCNWIFDINEDPLRSRHHGTVPLKANEEREASSEVGRPPRSSPTPWNGHRQIFFEVSKVSSYPKNKALLLPESFGPFQGMDVDMTLIHRESDSESVRPPLPDSNVHGSDANGSNEGSSKSWFTDTSGSTCMVECKPSNIRSHRLRSQWSLLEAMQPENFIDWRLVDVEKMNRLDVEEHRGSMIYNDLLPNSDIWASNSLSHLLLFDSIAHFVLPDPPIIRDGVSKEEMDVRNIVGNFLSNIISTDTILVRCHEQPQSHPFLSACRHPAFVDVIGVPATSIPDWGPLATPVIFAAQYIRHDHAEAYTQLAQVFHQTIIVLILYYLDTRRSMDDPLPSWMYLYGIVYDDDGFDTVAHYPLFWSGKEKGGRYGWGASSRLMNRRFYDIFSESPQSRGPGLASLLRIQSHNKFILNQLQAWDGYGRSVQLLTVSHYTK